MFLLIVLFIVSVVALSRPISFYFGVTAIAYQSLILLFLYSFFRLRPPYLLPVDRSLLAMMSIGIIWLPIGMLMAMALSIVPSMGQQLSTFIFYIMTFAGYFSIRYASVAPVKLINVMWVILLTCAVGGSSIYLHQIGAIENFYPDEWRYVYFGSLGEQLFRNVGIYGNPHDAGNAMAHMSLILFAVWWSNKVTSFRATILVLFYIAFGALFLTDSRSSLLMVVVSIALWVLIFEPHSRKYGGAKSPTISKSSLLILISAIFILIFSFLLSGIQGNIFTSTLWYNKGFQFIQSEGRLSSSLAAIDYLLFDDPIRSLFGWGFGTGGIAASKAVSDIGVHILPVNTVDQLFISNLANFGILGLILINAVYIVLIKRVFNLYVGFVELEELGLVAPNIRAMALYAFLALVSGYVSTFLAGHMESKIYPVFLFLSLGASMNIYSHTIVSNGIQPVWAKSSGRRVDRLVNESPRNS